MSNQFWLLRIHRKIVAEKNGTERGFDIIEHTVRKGAYIPWHMHNEYIEHIYVLDGQFTLQLDPDPVILEKGSSMLIPKSAPHALSFANSDCRILSLFAPGGIARIIRKTGTPGSPDGTEQAGDLTSFFHLFQLDGNIILPDCSQPL